MFILRAYFCSERPVYIDGVWLHVFPPGHIALHGILGAKARPGWEKKIWFLFSSDFDTELAQQSVTA